MSALKRATPAQSSEKSELPYPGTTLLKVSVKSMTNWRVQRGLQSGSESESPRARWTRRSGPMTSLNGPLSMALTQRRSSGWTTRRTLWIRALRASSRRKTNWRRAAEAFPICWVSRQTERVTKTFSGRPERPSRTWVMDMTRRRSHRKCSEEAGVNCFRCLRPAGKNTMRCSRARAC